MTTIDLDFPHLVISNDDNVGIPDLVRFKTNQLIQHAVRVTIEDKKSNGKYGKANGFKLTPMKNNEGFPQEDPQDVAVAIMNCINSKYAEHVAEDENTKGVDFRIVYDQRTPRGRQRPAVELQGYSPDGPDLPIDFNTDSASETQVQVIEQMGTLVDRLIGRIDGLIVHVITLSDQGKSIFEPLVEMMAMSNQNHVIGMEMQRRAMQFIFDAKRIDAEEAGKDRRAEKWMEWSKKPFNTAVTHFGKYMQAKMARSGVDSDDGEEEEDTDSGATDGGGPSDDQAGSDTVEMEHPVAEFAQALGLQLRPAQWNEATGILTKKQFSLLTRLLEAQTDEMAISLYDKIEEGAIPLVKMVALNAVLTPEQQEGLANLRKLVAWRKAEGEKDTSESSSGATAAEAT